MSLLCNYFGHNFKVKGKTRTLRFLFCKRCMNYYYELVESGELLKPSRKLDAAFEELRKVEEEELIKDLLNQQRT